MGIFKVLTLSGKGLMYKFLVAFALMSIIPLLVCVYIVSNYVFPGLKNISDVSIVTLGAIIVAFLGGLLARQLIKPVIDMAIEARLIASGEYHKNITIEGEDEVGHIAGSINSMTKKIRMNLEEIKGYSSRMREINVEINKKVLAMSSLLQIGDILSTGEASIDSLLDLALEKTSSVFDSGFGIIYMPRVEGEDFVARTTYNMEEDRRSDISIKRGGRGVLEKIINDNVTAVIDKSSRLSPELEDFKRAYNMRNALIIPLVSGKKAFGLMIVGNRVDNFKFKVDDIDLVKVFAKQIVIAIEGDYLAKRAANLAIKDELTDLYNKSYITIRLEEEIKRAIFYQRPCSFILINIDNFKDFRDTNGELAAEEAIRKVAKLIKDNVTPVSKVARVGGDEFAILLPEKNKKEAASLAEEMRKRLGSANLLREGKATLTVSCGVSENPIDGATSGELYKKATDAVKKAKDSGKDKVAV